MPKQHYTGRPHGEKCSCSLTQAGRVANTMPVSDCCPGPFQKVLPPLLILKPGSGWERGGKGPGVQTGAAQLPLGEMQPPPTAPCSESVAWRTPKLHHPGSHTAAETDPSGHRRACQPQFLLVRVIHQEGARGEHGRQERRWMWGERVERGHLPGKPERHLHILHKYILLFCP